MTARSASSRSARITRYTHSCVRIERHGTVLVIDPGIWSEPSALCDADAVLITHEHGDHIDVLRLAGLGVPVYAPADAHISGLDVIRVNSCESFTAAGFTVTAVGARHAPVFGDEPDCANHGYIIDDRIYHPGDALVVPDQPVETLFVPLQASWLKTAEAISFLRAVRPERAFGIHDAQINSRGLQGANSWLTDQGRHGYRYLAPGEDFNV
ncbi:MAG: MBL fold metallo-hydrolase [Actinomycetota bacterium]|nr:MBL fold metallo-hydrolase [Actinomycetota bacterium]